MSLVIGPFKQLITMKGTPLRGALKNEQMAILEHAGIKLENGTIIEVGDYHKLADTDSKVHEVDKELVAFPGFIDAHTHLIWGGSRALDFERRNGGMTYQEILNEGGGIHDTVNKTNQASEKELASALVRRINRHLHKGVTTVEIKSGYGLTAEKELRLLRCVRAVGDQVQADLIPTFLGAHVCPANTEKKEYLEHLVQDAFPVLKKESLARRIDIFIEEEAFGSDLAIHYLGQARKEGFDITTHAGQFSADGVKIAVEAGAVSADHLESIGAQEIKLLAESDTAAVALPGASIGLGMAFTPMRKILNAGGIGVIATDWNPGSGPMGDLLTQSAILASFEKLTAAEVFAGITSRAAYALRLNDRGVLDAGFLADLVAFPCDDYREILYHQGQMQPTDVWKAGQKIV